MVNPITGGNAVLLDSVRVNDFKVRNLRGKWGAFGVDILATATIDRWAPFTDIYADDGAIFRILAGATTPAVLTIANCKGEFASQNDTYAGVFLGDADVTQLTMQNVETKNVRYFLQTSASAPATVELLGCRSITPLRHHVNLGAAATLVKVIGGEYSNPGTAAQSLITGAGVPVSTTVELMGVKTSGANLTPILGNTYTTVAHFGNDFHTTSIFSGTPTELLGGSLNGALVLRGTGTPESAVTAPVGSLFTRRDGGAGTTLYVKESGSSSTGWVAK